MFFSKRSFNTLSNSSRLPAGKAGCSGDKLFLLLSVFLPDTLFVFSMFKLFYLKRNCFPTSCDPNRLIPFHREFAAHIFQFLTRVSLTVWLAKSKKGMIFGVPVSILQMLFLSEASWPIFFEILRAF